MRKKFERVLLLVSAAAIAFGSAACSISTESILEMEEGSEIVIEFTTFPLPQINMPLEGGVVMNIDMTIGFFDLLFGNLDGDVSIGDLLFAAPPFSVLGNNTEEVCIVKDGEGSGTFEADIHAETATFDVTMNTIALIGNEALSAQLGGGLPFPFDLQSTIPMTLVDMLGMLTGAGSLSVTQEVDLDILLLGAIPAHAGGQLTLAGTDTFPTSPLLDGCIAFLNE